MNAMEKISYDKKQKSKKREGEKPDYLPPILEITQEKNIVKILQNNK